MIQHLVKGASFERGGIEGYGSEGAVDEGSGCCGLTALGWRGEARDWERA
jgi:hypothetical protein